MKLLRSLILFCILQFSVTDSSGQLDAEEKILFNAKIFTANRMAPYAEAVLIRGKKIMAVGNLAEVKKAATKKVVFIDMNGGFLMPGMIDSHTHPVDGGDGLLRANLFDNNTTVGGVADYAISAKESGQGMIGDFLVIDGINISLWSQLDTIRNIFNTGIFSTQAVWLRGSDGHTSWVNDAAMKNAGITKEYIQSLSGEDLKFYGYDKNMQPNGFMSEGGQDKVFKMLPDNAIDYDKAGIKALEYNNGYGITAWLDPSTGSTTKRTAKILETYAKLARQNKMTAHVVATLVADADAPAQPQVNWVKSLQQQYNQSNLSIVGFKIFADGVIEHPTQTAALSKPYTGTSSKGVLMYDAEKFKQFVINADRQNMLVHVHAIGDLAVTKTLDGFEAARRLNPTGKLPHTITHMQIVRPTDFTRFKQLNIPASLQLFWALGDVTTIDIVKPYIDSTLYQYQYPARSLLQAGATICGASDWPVTTGNPFDAMYEAETRLGDKGVLDSTQCMPRIEMLYAYTINSAKALMQEKKIGSIEIGKSADIILIDRDILAVDPRAFKESRVQWTMFEGKIIYNAKKHP